MVLSRNELYRRAYKARSLAGLDIELHKLYPGRPNSGWVGDAAHEARKSEHNPSRTSSPVGSVDALDIYVQNLSYGQRVDILKQLMADSRTWYVIHKLPGKSSQIWSKTTNNKPKLYKGAPHDKHIHISIHTTEAARDDTRLWYPPKPTLLAGAEDDMVFFVQEEGKGPVWATNFITKRHVTNPAERRMIIAVLAKNGQKYVEVNVPKGSLDQIPRVG